MLHDECKVLQNYNLTSRPYTETVDSGNVVGFFFPRARPVFSLEPRNFAEEIACYKSR